MFNRNWIFFVLIILISNVTLAQSRTGQNRPDGRGQGLITGEVHDVSVNAPIEYANVILYSSRDSSQINGTISDKDGKFQLARLRPGNYYLVVQFIGYERQVVNNLSITPSAQSVDAGIIMISPSAINLNGVVVEGERTPVTYQIDKKVIDVSQMGTTISGNAADVLENVPSVSVDIEGNVSVRGSGNFTVLIDGRPSVIEAQDALQQIPASSIQTIELVTNPSAKYDPEGTAGIINIILKKNQNLGVSGIFNANAGFNDKYGGDFLVVYKTPSVNYNFGLDYNRRLFPGDSRNERKFISDNTTSYINSFGDSKFRRNSFGLRGNLEFNLGSKDYLSFGGRYGSRENLSSSSQNYSEWSDNDPQIFSYLSRENSDRSGTFYSLNMNYQHKFDDKNHELLSEFFFSHRNSDETSTNYDIIGGRQFSGIKSTESGPSTDFRGKIDYILQLSTTAKFEAGTQGEIDISEENTSLADYDTLSNTYISIPRYNYKTDFNESELAIYSIYSDQFGKLGIQGGIRTEYTYRTVKSIVLDEKINIDRWDYFPSFHTSYSLTGVTQLMGSYTRRIDRPRGWQLEPFETWSNDKNVRVGNPALNPEFIDSYEFGFKTLLGTVSFSNELYYRVTHNTINFINSVYPGSDNITLTTFQNVGTDYSLGSEFMFMLAPISFWDFSLMGNLYNYEIEGSLNNQSFARQSFNWSTRVNNTFNIGKSTQLQFNTRYNSPTVTAQGKSEGFFTSDLAVKQDVLDKALSLTLQVRDIFKTGKREFKSEGINFYNYSYGTREAPVVMLNLRFNFNNNKRNNERGREEQEDNDFEGGEEL